jgi:hypothetical protein
MEWNGMDCLARDSLLQYSLHTFMLLITFKICGWCYIKLVCQVKEVVIAIVGATVVVVFVVVVMYK